VTIIRATSCRKPKGYPVCIAYTWTLILGVDLEKAGKRREVDRASKPQLSLFQFAFRYLRRLFVRREEMPKYFRLSTS
jgi:hypothetical protein